MDFLLDSANPRAIESALEIFPIVGVTTNPSILKADGCGDFFALFREIRSVIGYERTMHVQVTAERFAEMMSEAEAIHARIDSAVYIKIPVTSEGLRAIRALKKAGCAVTATAIYSTAHALLAAASGADVLAFYVNRMENFNIDPYDVLTSTAAIFQRNGVDAKILGASFKNVGQMMNAFRAGADEVTVSPELLRSAVQTPLIEQAVSAFSADWRDLFGAQSIDQFEA